jgi:hypothetical protein
MGILPFVLTLDLGGPAANLTGSSTVIANGIGHFNGSGGAKTGGCALTGVAHYILTSFQANDTAYVRDSAKRGILEKVVVKEVLLTRNRLTFNQYLVKYKDTFNRLYIEGDLLDEYNALLLIEAYLERKQADIDAQPCN